MHLTSDNYAGQTIYTVREKGTDIGHVVLDSPVNGKGRGGLRLVNDLSLDELRAAARAMTLKYGFLGLPQGGAKAGVTGDPESPLKCRHALLSRFAEAIAPLLRSGRYVPDSDMGTDAEDIRAILSCASLPAGRSAWRCDDSGYYTAVSAVAAAEAALEHRGHTLTNSTVALEGFGSVGSAAARLMAQKGASIVAISNCSGGLYRRDGLDVNALLRFVRQNGESALPAYKKGERLSCEAVRQLPVTLFCPCARYHSIDRSNAAAISADVVCGGANNPVSHQAQGVLSRSNVLYVPDFVSNSGGVLGGTMEYAGIPPQECAAYIEGWLKTAVCHMLSVANRRQETAVQLATRISLKRFEASREAAEKGGILSTLRKKVFRAYRRGIPPAGVMGLVSRAYIMERVRFDIDRYVTEERSD